MRDVHFYSLVTLSEVNKKISPLNVWKKSTQKIPKAKTCEEICEANPPPKKEIKRKNKGRLNKFYLDSLCLGADITCVHFYGYF